MKIALRQLLKSPGFTLIALVTLALGIGVNTSQFTILNRLMLGSSPYPAPEQLVQIWNTYPQWQNGNISPGDYGDIREQQTVFTHLSVYCANTQKSIVLPNKAPERVTAMAVTADFFPTLDVTAALGRTFRPEEQAEKTPVAVLSHAYWQNQLGGDPQVLGRTLRFDGNNITVIGVMSPAYDDPQLWGTRIDLWHLDFLETNRQVRDKTWYSLIARLKPGVTAAQADAELKTIAARLAHDYPQTNEQRGLRAERFSPDYLGDIGRNLVWMLMALTVTVLLIACVNLVNLQLVRVTGRAREYAVRLALGASRGQLARLLLTESLLLTVAGGLLGLLVAKWSNHYFATYLDLPLPLDGRVLAYTFGLSLFAGGLSGILPAWFASRADLNTALKQGSRGATADRSRHRLRHGLIVAELALALTLLAGAGFFIRGIQKIAERNLHWRPENVLSGYFELPYAHYGDDTNVRHEVFTEKLLTALQRLPGVDHAAISLGTPALGPSGGTNFQIEGQAPAPKGQEPVTTFSAVTPGYFATYGIALLQGRNFTEADRRGAPSVIIISESMARKFWPGENPIGKRIAMLNPAGPPADWLEIVGVASNAVFGPDWAGLFPPQHFYWPWAQHSNRFPTFSLHSATDPRVLGGQVRLALATIEPDVAITNLSTAEEAMQQNLSTFTLIRKSLVFLAGLGLLLSAVGIYGVITHLATERTPEIGVRMALGAQPRDVVWLFLRNGIFLSLLGTGIGATLSFFLMRVLVKALVVIPGNDPWIIAGLALILIFVALFACWWPARRATKVDPMVALRTE